MTRVAIVGGSLFRLDCVKYEVAEEGVVETYITAYRKLGYKGLSL